MAKNSVSITINLKKESVDRISLLMKALNDKMGKHYTIGDLIQKMVDEFFGK
jgi:hypothetical protein